MTTRTQPFGISKEKAEETFVVEYVDRDGVQPYLSMSVNIEVTLESGHGLINGIRTLHPDDGDLDESKLHQHMSDAAARLSREFRKHRRRAQK